MKCKVIAFFLCIVFVCTLCLPVYADSDSSSNDGYSAIISDIPKVCPTCGSALHAFWFSTAGAEVELSISDEGKVTIPAGAGVFATINLKCKSCGYEKAETRLFGLDWGNEKPGQWEVKEAPSGIGRKDLPGYADDNGTPLIGSDGAISLVAKHWYTRGSGQGYENQQPVCIHSGVEKLEGYYYSSQFSCSDSVCSISSSAKANYISGVDFYFKITFPLDGNFSIFPLKYSSTDSRSSYLYRVDGEGSNSQYVNFDSGSNVSGYVKANTTYYYNFQIRGSYTNAFSATVYNPIFKFVPSTSTITNNNSITINHNTWNGNIYTDNSTNLTYIYPQYTTINEKNETVTNISNTPIIYNSETKQYYTYDQTTKNYYYITYNSDPAPSPTPTPAPTDKPGGSSGSSWWDKLLDKIGNAVIDGLLGAVSTVLKLIFKLLSTILGWIIWAVSLVFTLFPFLPPGLSGLLVGGVVVCFIIGIIKFIRG